MKYIKSGNIRLAKAGKYLLLSESPNADDYKVTHTHEAGLISMSGARREGAIPPWVWGEKVLPIYRCKRGFAIPMPVDGPEEHFDLGGATI